MSKTMFRKLSNSESCWLTALQDADEALYRLWRGTVLDSDFAKKISELQEDHIHPAIEELRRKP